MRILLSPEERKKRSKECHAKNYKKRMMLLLEEALGIVRPPPPPPLVLILKICKDCGLNKLVSEFYKNKCGNPMCRCKDCHRILTDKWKTDHPGIGAQWAARYRKENPEKSKETNKRCAKNRKNRMTDEEKFELKMYFRENYSKNKFALLN